jgi:hypothetical protein
MREIGSLDLQLHQDQLDDNDADDSRLLDLYAQWEFSVGSAGGKLGGAQSRGYVWLIPEQKYRRRYEAAPPPLRARACSCLPGRAAHGFWRAQATRHDSQAPRLPDAAS